MANGDKVIVGCKLPHGIILEHPKDAKVKVHINGLNKIVVIGADHSKTEVDADFWAAWSAKNKEFPAILSGALFFASDVESVESIAVETKAEKTGFEPMKKDAGGVKAADKD